MGSTMIEENVVRAAGVSYQMDKEEIELLINDLGYEASNGICIIRYFKTTSI